MVTGFSSSGAAPRRKASHPIVGVTRTSRRTWEQLTRRCSVAAARGVDATAVRSSARPAWPARGGRRRALSTLIRAGRVRRSTARPRGPDCWWEVEELRHQLRVDGLVRSARASRFSVSDPATTGRFATAPHPFGQNSSTRRPKRGTWTTRTSRRPPSRQLHLPERTDRQLGPGTKSMVDEVVGTSGGGHA